MSAMLDIPVHDCKNCGECCGVIPASGKEIRIIARYAIKHSVVPKNNGCVCPFRDEEHRKCGIYPVRPIVCRLMGVVEGMECANGNSFELDGGKYLKKVKAAGKQQGGFAVLNFIDWASVKIVSIEEG